MKQIRSVITILSVILLLSCNRRTDAGEFTVAGEIKNAPDQKIYLEELYFSQKEPAVLDTADMRKGKFELQAIAPGQGLYRVRLEKSEAPFFFINDKADISLAADFNNLSLGNVIFNSPANYSLRKFLTGIEAQRSVIEQKTTALQQYANKVAADSLYNQMQMEYVQKESAYENFVLQYTDTTTNPIVALFTLGYTQGIEPDKLEKTIAGLTKRFAGNQSVAMIVAQYNQMIAQYKGTPHEGGAAPDINMPDTSGKNFALSMLRGKYVLVDFWASWCGPCREENPNVVTAYNQFKDKNFTVLGVSLDKEKESWIKAISDDQLSWYHISDLKQWNSAAVPLYRFDGIPYNVLVNPEGKIVATNLRGSKLLSKLAELLKQQN